MAIIIKGIDSRCAGKEYGAKAIHALLSPIIKLLTCLLVVVIIRFLQQTDAAERCRSAQTVDSSHTRACSAIVRPVVPNHLNNAFQSNTAMKALTFERYGKAALDYLAQGRAKGNVVVRLR